MALPEQQHSIESVIEETLFLLGNLEVDLPSRFKEAVKLLTEKTASIFRYDRVGLWFFDEEKKVLTAENVYDTRFRKHISGVRVGISDYPLYVEVLRTVRAHSIPVINESNVPSDLLLEYFKKFDIRSLISSSIWHKGDLIGVISGSTVGRNHSWSLQERLYFASLGDLVSKWIIESTSDSSENTEQRISLRKLVKELSILCSRGSFVGFKEATQTSLTSINKIVHAHRTRAIVIENRDSYFLSSATEEIKPVPIDLSKKIFLLATNSKVIWIPDISQSHQYTTQIIKKLGFKDHSAVLIAPFGTSNEHRFHDEKTNTHGVLCIEFRPPAPPWNDTLKEVLLCATEAFSILAQHAHTKALYRESLDIARAAFEHSSVGMVLFNSVGKILKINKSFTKMIGGQPEHYHRMSIWKAVPSLLDHFLHLETIKNATDGSSYQFEEMLNSSTDKKWGLFNISFVPGTKDVKNRSEGYFLLQALDITQRKKALIALSEQRTFFRTVIDTDPNFIFAKDKNGVFTLANKAVAEAYGTTVEGILGKTDSDFNSNQEQVNGYREDDLYVLREGKILNEIEEVITDSKGATRYLQTVKSPIFDKNGVPIYVLGVSTDITERKKSEEKKQELLRKLEHTQKLESLGVLASGIAHDFNNLLLGIIGNSALSLKYIEEGSPAKSFIEKTVAAAENATELTSQLLSYSGKGTFFITPVELTTAVRETSMLVERITEKKGNVIFSVPTEDIIIDADMGQLRQVILNLITNAADAIETTNGEIVIKTDTQYLDSLPPDVVSEDFRVSKGTYAVLEVQDNGCGMSDEVKRNIFDPFFTTKSTGRGLGLASVLGIVRSHKGMLCLTSSPGQGSNFRIYLPLSKSPDKYITEKFSPNPLVRPTTNHNVRVLLIEDDIIPREVCMYMLESYGYKVITARNGEEGVILFKQHMDSISAIILDWTMPKLDGSEVFKRIRSLNKKIPILITSGHDENHFSQSFSNDLFSGFIQKPFVPASLEAALHSLFHNAKYL